MQIPIRIIYIASNTKVMQQGSFPVSQKKFKEDPAKEAARVAHSWLKEIKREMNVEEIVLVVYDGENDITDLVKELENARFIGESE